MITSTPIISLSSESQDAEDSGSKISELQHVLHAIFYAAVDSPLVKALENHGLTTVQVVLLLVQGCFMIFNGPNNLGSEALVIILRVKKEGMSNQINGVKNRHVVSLGLPISIIMVGFDNIWFWRGRNLSTKEINTQVWVRGRSRAKVEAVDDFLGINGKDFIGHGMSYMFGNAH